METYSNRKYVEIDLSTEIQKQLEDANPDEQRDIAFRYILNHLRHKKCFTHDGRLVKINRRGAQKITHLAPLEKLRATPYLAELIETSQSIGLDDAEHRYFKQFAYYEIIFKLGDRWYAGVLNIGVHKDDTSSLYDLNPFTRIEESRATLSGVHDSG